jgi:hypothetical protein
MRQSNESEGIKVSVARFGQSTITLNVPLDSTVSEVLELAGIETQGNEQLFVAGTTAKENDILESDDVLSIVTPKQAASN